jgi:hypothetical protein
MKRDHLLVINNLYTKYKEWAKGFLTTGNSGQTSKTKQTEKLIPVRPPYNIVVRGK